MQARIVEVGKQLRHCRAKRRLVRSVLLIATVASVGLSRTAMAGFTTINSGGANTQASILDHVYGGNFTLASDGVDYTNGTDTALRVSDTLPSSSTSDNPGPNATDQLWQANQVVANVQALFAADPSTPFGYIPGASGGSFQSLFTVSGSGYAVTGNGSFAPTGTFRFAAENKFGLLSTLPSDNSDDKDHVVTYEINGLGDSFKTWLLFFNDYGNTGSDPDFTFQNLVVQVKTVPQSSVPEPGNLMLIGGVALALLTRLPRRVS